MDGGIHLYPAAKVVGTEDDYGAPLTWEDARWLVHLAFIMKKFIQKIVIAY